MKINLELLEKKLETTEISNYLLNEIRSERLLVDDLKEINLLENKDLWLELIKNQNAYNVFALTLYSYSEHARELIKTYGMKTVTDALNYASKTRKSGYNN